MEVSQFVNRLDWIAVAFSLQQGGQALTIGEVKVKVLLRISEVCVDQERGMPKLREHDREIGCQVTSAFTSVGADHSECFRGGLAFQPPHQQLRSQSPKGLGLGAMWFVGSDDVLCDSALTIENDRVVVLAGDGEFNVISGDQAKLNASLAKQGVIVFLPVHNAFGGLRREAASADQNGTD